MTERRAIIIANEKIMPFQVFQAHCDERRFVYTGKPGNFNVLCKLCDKRCNKRNCPIWNSNRVAAVPKGVMSLRDVNLALRSSNGDTDGRAKDEAIHEGSAKRDTKA